MLDWSEAYKEVNLEVKNARLRLEARFSVDRTMSQANSCSYAGITGAMQAMFSSYRLDGLDSVDRMRVVAEMLREVK